MGKISLLDCTLRDGGYINNWRFGEDAICNIAKKLILTGIEYFEAGFVRECEYDKNYALFNGNESIKSVILPKSPDIKYTGMIDMNKPIPLETLGKRDAEGFDVLRVIFKKNKIKEAYDYIKQLIGMGYEVFAQAVGTDVYSDSEFIGLIHMYNTLSIKAFYIVDSFGLIQRKDFLRFVQVADHNLRKDVALGYHSHNNMQQAFGNASAMAELNLRRDIIIDACVFGMGRGAGNLNLELFAGYMNENFGKQYKIEPMLEIIDEYLNNIYRENFWGYSLPLYLAAKNGCHPNYAIYLSAKGTFTMKSFNELLKSIPETERRNYSKENAERLYKEYQENYIDDRCVINELKEKFKEKRILLLGSGKTIAKDREVIQRHIEEVQPIVIALNFIPREYPCDYVFSCHMRRYKHIQNNESVTKIITSNLREAKKYDYMINFASYAAENSEIMENSGIVCINFLIRLGVKEIVVAGMDGYDIVSSRNYVNIGLECDFSPEILCRRNLLIKKELEQKSSEIKINFLTKSIYQNR